MNLNLNRLISSEEHYYQEYKETLASISEEPDGENVLRNIVMFCKQIFSSSSQRKKYLCLLFIKDLFQTIQSEYLEKLIDQYIASKLLNIVQAFIEGKIRDSRTGSEDRETSQRLYYFAVETITFWAKRLSVHPKSTFSQVYQQIKKMKVEIPSVFMYYKRQHLINLWKNEGKQHEQNEEANPMIQDLFEKFKECKKCLENTINDAVLNDQEVLIKPIVQKTREFLIQFFNKYRELEEEENRSRDILIVYFHIINHLYKKICNRLHVSVQELIKMTKETFQVHHSPEYDSVDRMDIIGLAGVVKYNALSIFQRIHHKIEKHDRLLGPCNVSLNLQYSEKKGESYNISMQSGKSPSFKEKKK